MDIYDKRTPTYKLIEDLFCAVLILLAIGAMIKLVTGCADVTASVDQVCVSRQAALDDTQWGLQIPAGIEIPAAVAAQIPTDSYIYADNYEFDLSDQGIGDVTSNEAIQDYRLSVTSIELITDTSLASFDQFWVAVSPRVSVDIPIFTTTSEKVDDSTLTFPPPTLDRDQIDAILSGPLLIDFVVSAHYDPSIAPTLPHGELRICFAAEIEVAKSL